MKVSICALLYRLSYCSYWVMRLRFCVSFCIGLLKFQFAMLFSYIGSVRVVTVTYSCTVIRYAMTVALVCICVCV